VGGDKGRTIFNKYIWGDAIENSACKNIYVLPLLYSSVEVLLEVGYITILKMGWVEGRTLFNKT
jgi:hypothetical protein